MTSILERLKNRKTKPAPDSRFPTPDAADPREAAMFREIDEEVQVDKVTDFVKKNMRIIIAFAVALVLMVAGLQWWRSETARAQMLTATMYETAVMNRDVDALAALAARGRGGVVDLALFQAYVISGDLAHLEKLKQRGRTRDFRDLARLHLAAATGDEMTPTQLHAFLRPLLTRRSPFYFSAQLMLAQKYLSVGDTANANPLLDRIINNNDAPVIIRASATTLR